MKDFEIIELQEPVIKANFDDMKASLEDALKKYAGLIVTEKTYPDAKAQMKDIAGLRRKIDDFRKEKKAELSKPIASFENRCKELITLIEQVEEPIREGVAVFDNARREEKRKAAEQIIKDTAKDCGLNETHASRITVNDKWLNLTAKESDVKSDIEILVMSLLKDQEAEAERISIITQAIERANADLKTKIEFSEFQHLVDRGVSTPEILDQIGLQRDKLKTAESSLDAPEAPVDIQMPEPQENAPSKPTGSESGDAVYWGRLYISGSNEKLNTLIGFLNEGKYEYRLEGTGTI
jgi:histone H3/H4